MGIFMRENGLMIKPMDLGDIIIQMVPLTVENGRMINSMVMVKNNGQMDQSIRGIMQKGKNMVRGYCNLLMDHITMENLTIMIYMEKVSLT